MKTKAQRLTRAEVGGIVKMLSLTTDHELDCGECLRHVGEYAEGRLANRPVDEVIAGVEQHLALCPECREEFEALMRILQTGQ
jgi:hypothetical protein